jgi:hypothetical protein
MSTSTGTSTADPIEQLGRGVTCQWHNDSRIIEVRAENSSPDAVDLWVDKITDVIRKWPKDRPCLTLVDVSSEKIATTPYVRERAKGLATLRNDLQMFTAMVLPHTFFAQIARIVTRRPMGPNVHMRVFTARDEALKWLQGKISG